ncbi:UNVERIFIED_CONTAM: hypothetical protein FKN15_068377 [Acipenser sinensis]
MQVGGGRMQVGAGRREQAGGSRADGGGSREEGGWNREEGAGSGEQGGCKREQGGRKREQAGEQVGGSREDERGSRKGGGGSREEGAGREEQGGWRREQGGGSDLRMAQTIAVVCFNSISLFFFCPVNEVAVYSLQAPEPRNRAEFLKYSCQLTLDPNTANRYICLSEGNRKVTYRRENQRYRDHPERFDILAQVLCSEGLSGTRCYWEIEWSGGRASIGVTYKGISRKGEDHSCGLGFNDKSWSLFCSDSSYTARHNNNRTAITAPSSPRIGVYLDFNAGTLSFYGV